MIQFLQDSPVLSFFVFTGLTVVFTIFLFEAWLLVMKLVGLKQRFLAVKLVNMCIIFGSLMMLIQLTIITGKGMYPQDFFLLSAFFWCFSLAFYLIKRFLKKVPV